jgi:hydrogenase nickel incorporation protein HypA/HybF
MHEMSLIGSLHDIVNDAATRSAFTRVRQLHLSLGRLSCVDPETLRWCIATTSAGTCLEHAEIIITIEAALAHCEHCKQDYEPDTLITPCPHCGHNAQKILRGRDMRITALDVEPIEAPDPTLPSALSNVSTR